MDHASYTNCSRVCRRWRDFLLRPYMWNRVGPRLFKDGWMEVDGLERREFGHEAELRRGDKILQYWTTDGSEMAVVVMNFRGKTLAVYDRDGLRGELVLPIVSDTNYRFYLTLLPEVIVVHVRGVEDSLLLVDRAELAVIFQEPFTHETRGVLRGYTMRGHVFDGPEEAFMRCVVRGSLPDRGDGYHVVDIAGKRYEYRSRLEYPERSQRLRRRDEKAVSVPPDGDRVVYVHEGGQICLMEAATGDVKWREQITVRQEDGSLPEFIADVCANSSYVCVMFEYHISKESFLQVRFYMRTLFSKEALKTSTYYRFNVCRTAKYSGASW